MAEKSENEASTTGQDVETPETERSPQPETSGEAEAAQAEGTEGERKTVLEAASDKQTEEAPGENTGAYTESGDHVPDPTAMSGTLETSGTGGGVHESTRGVSGAFEPRVIEHMGLPLYQGDNVGAGDGYPAPHDGSDAQVATEENREAEEVGEQQELASSSDAVSTDSSRASGAEATSYSENTIAGAQDPNVRQAGESEGAATTAVRETPEDGSQEESKESAPAKKTAARKTTSSRTSSTKKS